MNDEILEYIKNSVDRIELNQREQDIRLRAVENWQSNNNGKSGAWSFICTLVGGSIVAVAEYFHHTGQ